MSPNDVQAILNCINNMNKAIDYKQWERLVDFLNDSVAISFQRSSIPKGSQITSKAYTDYLSEQLVELRSMHRDYNFFISSDQDVLQCKTDFKIETYTEQGQLISGASGTHLYTMVQVGGKWKIASVKREISRLEQVTEKRPYQLR